MATSASVSIKIHSNLPPASPRSLISILQDAPLGCCSQVVYSVGRGPADNPGEEMYHIAETAKCSLTPPSELEIFSPHNELLGRMSHVYSSCGGEPSSIHRLSTFSKFGEESPTAEIAVSLASCS